MYSLPTAPKTIGGVLDDTFNLFGAAWRKCWQIAVASAIVIAIPTVYLLLAGGAAGLVAVSSGAVALSVTLIYLATLIVAGLVYLALHVAMLVRINGIAAGDATVELQFAFRRGLQLMPRSLLASILVALPIIIAGIILGFVAGGFLVMSGAQLSPLAIVLVPAILLFLGIPYFVWATYRLLYNALIATSDVSALESLSVSKQLVQGNWWRTVAILTVALIVVFLLIICVQFASATVLLVVSRNPLMVAVGTQIMAAVASVFTAPWMNSAILSIYYDLKLRKEGGDLAQRVAALGQA